MIVSEKQVLQLFQVLTDSLCVVGGGSPFKYGAEYRRQLADEILRQQSDELKVCSNEIN